MPPPRPTAWEVSFPDEVVQEAPPSSNSVRISQATGNSHAPSSLKRKSVVVDGDGVFREQQRSAKRSARLPAAQYRLPSGIIQETAQYKAPGEEEAELDSERGTTIRVLYNFCVFETTSTPRNEFVSLDALETAESDRRFAAAGVVLLNDEDEEDYGQEDGADDVEENEREQVLLSDISLCAFDYANDLPIFIETKFATYELRGPSTRYQPFYKDFSDPRYLARSVIMTALARPRESLKEFRKASPQFTNEDLQESITYIREALEERDKANLSSRAILKELFSSIPAFDRRHRTRPCGRMNLNLQRSPLASRDLAVLKAETQTHVTPMVAQLARGYFEETLQVLGAKPIFPTQSEIETQRASALRFLKQCIARARQQEKRPQVSFARVHRGDNYAEEATIGGVVYKTGDFVCVRKGTYGNVPAPVLPVDLPPEAQLADYFWFARIIYFHIDSQHVHLQWLEHGSQIILQEMAHPQELFITMLCEDQPIRFISGKLSVVFPEQGKQLPKEKYFVRQVYNEHDISCTAMNETEMNRTFAQSPPNNCLPCNRTDAHNLNADWTILSEHAEDGENIPNAGVAYRSHRYHQHDFFLYNGDNGAAQIGYLERFRASKRRMALPKVRFTRVGRIGDLKGVDVGELTGNEYPERHVFLTDETAEVALIEMIRPIHVYSRDFFEDEAELKRWVNYSPYNFYCTYRLPSISTESWPQRVSVSDDKLYICRFCTSALYEETDLEEAFDAAEHMEGETQCLDLFGGTGAFSHAFAEGSRGLLKPTHLIEISPSAARTAQKNSPNLITYCQDANIVLRYLVKSKAGHDVEVPLQLWDDKTPIPTGDHLEPGKVRAIFAGLPCQSHSGLNMFRKAEDRKSNLILTAVSYVDFFRPSFFFLENVPGFLKYNLLAQQASRYRTEGGIEMGGLKLLLRALIDMGYQWRFSLLQAGNYGSPQNRVRFFLVAAKIGRPLPKMPQPTHDFEITNHLRVQLPYNHKPRIAPIRTSRGRAPHASVSIQDAIGDLKVFDWKHPDKKNTSTDLKKLINERKRADIAALECDYKSAHCGFEGDAGYGHKPWTSFQRQARERATQDIQHYTRCLLPKTVERVLNIPIRAGADFRDLPPHLTEWQFFNPLSAVGRNKFRGGLYGRLDADGYFPTTVTNMHPTAKQSRVLHPTCMRMVTVRELARSQGFPDWFCFVSVNDNVVTLHRQIGNAVPWQVSQALGRELRAVMFEEWKQKRPVSGEDVVMRDARDAD
ncbi:mitogen-activated protein kinase [Favolaschia claudopus]|uniref:DNA (cytosine-5-)-methyltransferase n=1 Tax=Favolaschia claudopus TaxID=2862362 RepID=A0AAW0EI97_9AGAR